MGTLLSWLGGEGKTIAFAIVAGVAGFIAKGVYELWTARRKERLDRVNQQLKLLYGPLYALNRASGLAWSAFRSRTRPGGPFFGTNPPPTSDELEAWRLWMRTVFEPMQKEMLSIITKNADLLIERDLPAPLQLFCAHVAAYAVVFERWERKDFSEYTSVVNYPTQELATYLEKSFTQLKAEQARLLGTKEESPPAT